MSVNTIILRFMNWKVMTNNTIVSSSSSCFVDDPVVYYSNVVFLFSLYGYLFWEPLPVIDNTDVELM